MNNAKKVFLPPFKVERFVSTLGVDEVIDYGLLMTGVKDAWVVTEGEGITVMVIDSGYAPHDDLKDGMLIDKCKSFVSEGHQTIEDLGCGHGTHCLGIIGGRKNGLGVIGVAPKCNIISVKVFDMTGSGDFSTINDALRYAIETKPDVVSMSLGSRDGDEEMERLLQTLNDMNIPVICASGNTGGLDDVNYPAKYESVIAVGAIDSDGKLTNFSSKGKEVDFVAAGKNVYSCWLANGYARLSGTSMACPFISGVVALLLSKHKKQEESTGMNDCVTVEQIVEHLRKYADRNGAVVKDSAYGYGMIDVKKLIEDGNDAELIKPLGYPWNPEHLVLDFEYVFDTKKRGANYKSQDGTIVIEDGFIHLMPGFAWDGCSAVPSGPPDVEKPQYPQSYRASAIHDAIYRSLKDPAFKKLYSKSEADLFLYELLKECKFKHAKLYYWGVVIFGPLVLFLGRLKKKYT